MLKIWGRPNSINVQKAMWAVGELGLEHERVDVGGPFGGLDTPDYLAKNPNARIPTLEDGDLVLWESNVIVRYLAARYGAGSLAPADPALHALADQWMDWQQTTTLADMFVVFWGLIRTAPEDRNMAAIEKSTANLGGIMGRLDARLADRDYVTGTAFSMGDIPVGATCYRYLALDIERPDLLNIQRYYDRLQEREPFRTHVMIPLT